jgi:hypothetical protein
VCLRQRTYLPGYVAIFTRGLKTCWNLIILDKLRCLQETVVATQLPELRRLLAKKGPLLL